MTTRTIYEINRKDPNLNGITAEEFAESIGGTNRPCFEDITGKHLEQALENLRAVLSDAGFCIDKVCDYEGCVYMLRTGNADELRKARENYFSKRFNTVKLNVKEMTVDDFCTNRQFVKDLCSEIDKRNGDQVYYTHEPDLYSAMYSMDDFIRMLTPDTEYFISDTAISIKE